MRLRVRKMGQNNLYPPILQILPQPSNIIQSIRLKDLKKSRDLTYLFISHNLSVIRYMSDRIAVMYMGEIVELAEVDKLFENPLHPYTKMLMDSIPIPDPSIRKSFSMIKGELPSLLNPPKGCRFSTRCDFRMKVCETKHPNLIEVKKGHFVRCLKINE